MKTCQPPFFSMFRWQLGHAFVVLRIVSSLARFSSARRHSSQERPGTTAAASYSAHVAPLCQGTLCWKHDNWWQKLHLTMGWSNPPSWIWPLPHPDVHCWLVSDNAGGIHTVRTGNWSSLDSYPYEFIIFLDELMCAEILILFPCRLVSKSADNVWFQQGVTLGTSDLFPLFLLHIEAYRKGKT